MEKVNDKGKEKQHSGKLTGNLGDKTPYITNMSDMTRVGHAPAVQKYYSTSISGCQREGSEL